jgi:hypothetical protein
MNKSIPMAEPDNGVAEPPMAEPKTQQRNAEVKPYTPPGEKF